MEGRWSNIRRTTAKQLQAATGSTPSTKQKLELDSCKCFKQLYFELLVLRASEEELWLVPVERQLDVTEDGETLGQSAEFELGASWV